MSDDADVPPTHHAEPDRILIIRPSALGDVARTVPALATLRRAFPNATIDWLVREGFEDAVRHHPMLDGVISFRRWPLPKLVTSREPLRRGVRLRRRLRGDDPASPGRYDRVYDLQGLARSGLLAWLTRAPRRVGYRDAKELGWLGCNVRHRIDPSLHAVDRMLAVLQADGLEPVANMRLHLGDADAEFLSATLRDAGIGCEESSDAGSEGRYTCIAPGAKWGCKRWPVEHYAAVAARLIERRIAGEAIVLVGSPAELDEAQPIVDAVESAGGRALRPRTSVGQMMALVSGCRLLLCNDSAPLHVAVGFSRRIISIFGPTDPALVGPYRLPHCVVQPDGIEVEDLTRYRRHSDDDSLIRRVGVEQVWDRVCDLHHRQDQS